MKIGLILHPYNEKKQSGLGRYAWEVTKNIIDNDYDKGHKYVVFLKEKPERLPSFKGDKWSVEIIDKKYFWLDRGLWGQKLDICVFFTPIVPFFVKFKKTIIVVHDLSYKYIIPEKIKTKFVNFIINLLYTFSVRKAGNIIAVSNATKKDIIKFFNIAKEKISVVYNGCNDICSLDKNSINVTTPFFLFAGVVKPRKNVFNLVKAFNKFKKKDKKNFKLVITGSYGGEYYRKISNFIKKNDIGDDIVFLGYVTDSQLAFLYKEAYAFFYPSLEEGFGMTVLEAMSCGAPIFISNIDVFREIFLGSSILFNEKDYNDIARVMTEISNNETLRNSLSEKSLKHSTKFSWNKTASEFIKLINAQEKQK